MSGHSTTDIAGAAGPRRRVLALATLAFTILFAVWLMLGVLGLEIKADPQLMLGDAARSMSPDAAKIAIESRFEWLLAAALLSGALLRLHFGIWSDRFGGRTMMSALLVSCAAPTAWLAYAHNYWQLVACAVLFGVAGNSFSVGVSWISAWFPQESKGMALGVFGAGNIGAAGTKLLLVLAPGVLSLVPAAGWLGGWIPGGWRVIPLLYSMLLIAAATAILWFSPRHDQRPTQGRSLRERLAPLKYVRVWRFGLYYVVSFGAYVGLASWLPSYYAATYSLGLSQASLLAALFIFPASLARPLGGWLSDRFGPRAVMYTALIGMTLAALPLCLPASVVELDVPAVAMLLLAVATAMGIGMATVFKYIPDYFPEDTSTVGGLVGMLGALGGFLFPKTFGWLGRAAGFPQASFVVIVVLALVSLAWLHLVVVGIRSRRDSRQTLLELARVRQQAPQPTVR